MGEKVIWNRPSTLTSAAICSLVSAPLLWVEWLSGKSIRLASRRSWVQIPGGFQNFISLSYSLYHFSTSYTAEPISPMCPQACGNDADPYDWQRNLNIVSSQLTISQERAWIENLCFCSLGAIFSPWPSAYLCLSWLHIWPYTSVEGGLGLVD